VVSELRVGSGELVDDATHALHQCGATLADKDALIAELKRGLERIN